MKMFQIAFQAAGDRRSTLLLLIFTGFVLAMLEALTLLLIFSFTASLINTGAHLSGASSFLLGPFARQSLPMQASIVLGLATLRFLITLWLEWKMSGFWVEMRSHMQKTMLNKHLHAVYETLLSRKLGEHIHSIMEGPSFAAVFYLHFIRYVATWLMLIVLFATLFYISPALFTIGLIVALLYGVVIRQISTRVSYQSGQQRASAIKKQIELVSEGLSGIRYLKVQALMERLMDKFSEAAHIAQKAMHRAGYWNIFPSRSLEYLILVFFIVMVLFVAGTNIQNNLQAIPTVAVYFLGLVRVLPSLSLLGNGRMQMLQALPNLEKYLELRDHVSQEMDKGHLIAPSLKANDLVFDRLHFSYGQHSVLKDASFTIPAGKLTIITGPSGSGKSTIIDIILRLIEPASGVVKVSGTNISQFKLESWRKKFAYVGQDPFLFHDSILENLRMANPLATASEINDAVKLACADEFLTELPDGLNTILSDRGQSLSGGQRQRIALARAFIAPAEVIVLDEPTSALDSDTEQNVFHNLISLKGKASIILVTHYEGILKSADQVISLENGRITAYDDHPIH
jgi:ABC-type multidrug transport system fused ATPase/permease subunit